MILIMFCSCKDNSKKESPKINKKPIDTLVKKILRVKLITNPMMMILEKLGCWKILMKEFIPCI